MHQDVPLHDVPLKEDDALPIVSVELSENIEDEKDVVEPPANAEEEQLAEDETREPLSVELLKIEDDEEAVHSSAQDPSAPTVPQPSEPSSVPQSSKSASGADDLLYDDPSDSDDGEGEWITPSNVALHKSRALSLLPSAAGAKKRKQETIPVACMTADFAMQNVLLQMSLGLIGVEGQKIERVKSWVLRCHACFKFVFLSLFSSHLT